MKCQSIYLAFQGMLTQRGNCYLVLSTISRRPSFLKKRVQLLEILHPNRKFWKKKKEEEN